MANVDSPFGLKPVRYLNGSPWNGAVTRYYLNTSESNALFVGDAVDLVGTADSTGMVAAVTKATAGATNPLVGAIVAFEPDPTNLSSIYRTASTARYCYVADDPNIVFEIQGSTGGAIAYADVGYNGVLIMTHSGSTTTGISGMELSYTTIGADPTYQFLILNGVDRPDNDATLVHAKWEVIISLHRYKSVYTSAQYGLKGV